MVGREVFQMWLATLSRPEGSGRCRHTWGDPVAVSFSCDSRDVIRVCEPCQGFVRRCKRCRRFHLVYQGQGGEYSDLLGLETPFANDKRSPSVTSRQPFMLDCLPGAFAIGSLRRTRRLPA